MIGDREKDNLQFFDFSIYDTEVTAMDFEAIKKAAQGYQADMTKFLRDMIAIPSESCEEEGVVKRIAEEMNKLGYDKVEFDKLGNVIGWIGDGDKIIAIDSPSTPSASATSTTGKLTPIRATKPTRSSTAAAAVTRRAAWLPLLTAPRS